MAEEQEVVENKPKLSVLNRYAGLLKEILNYLIMAVISAFVAYMVSSSVKSKSLSSQDLLSYETSVKDVFERKPIGSDWTMDEMLVNTADAVDPKIVKAIIVISYNDKSPAVLEQLSLRRTEIHSAVRNVIGSKKSAEINTTEKQQILAQEIKTSVQRIIGIPGILEVYIKDFMVH